MLLSQDLLLKPFTWCTKREDKSNQFLQQKVPLFPCNDRLMPYCTFSDTSNLSTFLPCTYGRTELTMTSLLMYSVTVWSKEYWHILAHKIKLIQTLVSSLNYLFILEQNTWCFPTSIQNYNAPYNIRLRNKVEIWPMVWEKAQNETLFALQLIPSSYLPFNVCWL